MLCGNPVSYACQGMAQALLLLQETVLARQNLLSRLCWPSTVNLLSTLAAGGCWHVACTDWLQSGLQQQLAYLFKPSST
jgi:hypothetical protein